MINDLILLICRGSVASLNDHRWDVVGRKFKKSHSNILGLIDLILTLPASSTDAERGFSELKLTKTDWRARLRNTVLYDLLLIQFLTPTVEEFDPVPAIHHWNSSSVRARQPYFLDEESFEEEMNEEEYAALKKIY